MDNFKEYGHLFKNVTILFGQRMKELCEDLGNFHFYLLFLINKKGGEVLVKDLMKETYIRKSSLSVDLKNLEEYGYLVKITCESDTRKKEVKITEKGYVALNKIKEHIHKIEQKMRENISDSELKLCEKVVQKMILNLKEDRDEKIL